MQKINVLLVSFTHLNVLQFLLSFCWFAFKFCICSRLLSTLFFIWEKHSSALCIYTLQYADRVNRTTLNSYKKKLHTQSLCKLFQKVFFRGFLLASFFHFTSFIIIMITNIAYIAFKVLCCPHNFTFSYCSISTEFTQRFSLYFSFIISFLFSSYLFFLYFQPFLCIFSSCRLSFGWTQCALIFGGHFRKC